MPGEQLGGMRMQVRSQMSSEVVVVTAKVVLILYQMASDFHFGIKFGAIPVRNHEMILTRYVLHKFQIA